jgi:site-specific recombinase XerD
MTGRGLSGHQLGNVAGIETGVGRGFHARHLLGSTVLYGTGAEVSLALKLTRAEVDQATKEIRAAGTKTHTRHRMARVADWAWPIVWAYAKGHLPTTRLWRESLTRFTVSDWHRETVKALELPAYPLKNARHHWAVRMLKGGAPVHVVQAQLGHSTAKLT